VSFRVEVVKRQVLVVEADSAEQARALGMVVADGAASAGTLRRVRLVACTLAVEDCHKLTDASEGR
jgi:hypothetical protein